jgi:NAD(P) transhydrogenase subunit alpha
MKVGVLKETFPGEKRVALSPDGIKKITDAGAEVLVEKGAGQSAFLFD